jgi:uncharacterized membrane protein
MSRRVRLITRIALFSALVYVISWATSFLPNVSLAFFVAFAAGFLWGAAPGILVGGVGMWLWTTFNPYGPAALPVSIAQVSGLALSGLIGAAVRRLWQPDNPTRRWLALMLGSALVCTAIYFVLVSVVDAWVFQPFWPRFIAGLVSSLPALAANLLIFTLLFPVLRQIYERERMSQ